LVVHLFCVSLLNSLPGAQISRFKRRRGLLIVCLLFFVSYLSVCLCVCLFMCVFLWVFLNISKRSNFTHNA
jgi:hypothetical protein